MKSIDKWFVCGWVAVLFVSILACSSGDPDEPDPISSMDVCGGIVGQICTVDGEVCFFEESQNCGQFDQQGTCELPPEFCTKEYFPVCGCDGKTYGNACMARAAGASVEQQGECPPVIGQICGTRGAQPCPTGQVCFWDSSANCGRTDQAGYCDIAPTQCYLIHRPVCGCDGQTYGNDCLAHAAGVSIDYDGACQSGNACGSRGLAPCPSGEFCNYPTRHYFCLIATISIKRFRHT